MQLTVQHGYPDLIGRKRVYVGTGTAPTSYTIWATGTPPTGGDPITGLPFQTYIDSIPGVAVSTDGTYIAIPQAYGVGPRQTWVLRYFAFTNTGVGSEATTGTNLSTKKFQIFFIGGQY